MKSPALLMKSPVLQMKSPVLQMKSPVLQMKSLALLMLLCVMVSTLLAVPVNGQAQEQKQKQDQDQVQEPQQTQAPGITLEDMLAKIREQAIVVNNANEEREASFRNTLAQQESRTADALARRNAAEALGNQLSARYDANELRIEEMNVLLELHQGNLGELFGVTRQIAGDAAGVLGASMITTQFPAPEGKEDRVDFLLRLAAASALPSILELERLWLELMNEMNEDSKVARYTAPVRQAGGSIERAEVVRIGSFTAVADQGYLAYLPGEKAFALMTRQPTMEAGLMEAAKNLMDASPATAYVPAVVDPAQGAILALVVERPDFLERIAEGEVVGYIIIGVGAIGVLLALFQSVYLLVARLRVKAQTRHPDKPQRSNALGRVLLAVSGKGKDQNQSADELPEILEMRISEARLREVLKLERFQSFLRLAVAAGPLLGLIGTVIGMIITFESITASGSSDPKLMAQGIGQAMIATVLGLGVAIPLLFINTGLAAMSRSVIRVLEEQGTHLMASRLEQRLESQGS